MFLWKSNVSVCDGGLHLRFTFLDVARELAGSLYIGKYVHSILVYYLISLY